MISELERFFWNFFRCRDRNWSETQRVSQKRENKDNLKLFNYNENTKKPQNIEKTDNMFGMADNQECKKKLTIKE
jgi:hypothetical protein